MFGQGDYQNYKVNYGVFDSGTMVGVTSNIDYLAGYSITNNDGRLFLTLSESWESNTDMAEMGAVPTNLSYYSTAVLTWNTGATNQISLGEMVGAGSRKSEYWISRKGASISDMSIKISIDIADPVSWIDFVGTSNSFWIYDMDMLTR
jgi:hypothetical protein